MNEKDKQKIIDRYHGRLQEFGPVQKSLGWLKGRQGFRFHYLREIERFAPTDSVLDVGCAYGDLKAFLQKDGWKGAYTGVDIVPKLVEVAKQRYPGINTFVVDILTEKFEEKSDWVFCSGALTSKTETEDTYEYFRKMLHKMFSICNKGVAVNFCSPFVDSQSEVNFHPEIEKLLPVIVQITKRFTLRHDYMPYEFTVYMYKDDSIERSVNVFSSEIDLYNMYRVDG